MAVRELAQAMNSLCSFRISMLPILEQRGSQCFRWTEAETLYCKGIAEKPKILDLRRFD